MRMRNKVIMKNILWAFWVTGVVFGLGVMLGKTANADEEIKSMNGIRYIHYKDRSYVDVEDVQRRLAEIRGMFK